MKVLYAIGNTVSGGADAHLRSLLTHLCAKGIEAAVVCAYRGELFQWLCTQRIRTEVVPTSYDGMGANEIAYAVDRIAAILASDAFDLVHAHLMPAEVCAALACAVAKHPPVVSTIHEAGSHEGQARLGARLGITYICVCEAVKTNLVRHGVPIEKTVVIHNDVDTSVFTPAARDETLLRRLGFGEADVVLLTVARLAPEKNLALLLAAARQASRIEPSLRWLIVGEGPEESSLKRLAREHGLDGIVRFHEAVEQERLPRFYASTHAHVLPSTSEAFPLVNLEAMACGVPVVVTRVGGSAELVVTGHNGLIVPPDDGPALVKAMVWLARNRRRAASLGRRGRRDVEERFGAPRMAEAVADVYRSVLGRGARQEEPAAPEAQQASRSPASARSARSR